MTRLTFAVTGNPLTYRPVTSTITRETMDGDINMILLLLGTDYNIKMSGILQQSDVGDVDDSFKDIYVEASHLHMQAKQLPATLETAENIGTFSSFMFFAPRLKITGHVGIDESEDVTIPLPVYIGGYKFTDLLSGDNLRVELTRTATNAVLNFIEKINGVDNVIYTETLNVGIKEYNFEIDYLIRGKSSFYKIENYRTINETRTQVWLGDISAKIGECNVSAYCKNESTSIGKEFTSDYLLLNYPNMSIKYDATAAEKFLGRIKMYDDVNSIDENEWKRVRSRDYGFEGNRVIQNGLIRIIILTNNPEIEIYGWNTVLQEWEKSHSVLVDADNGESSFAIQNINIEFFNNAQLRMTCNFGTSVYKLAMTRGDPYIGLTNLTNVNFKIKSATNRMGANFKTGGINSDFYTLDNTYLQGSPTVRDLSIENLSAFSLLDNYFGFYNDNSVNEMVGFIGNAVNPIEIDIEIIGSDSIYTFKYPILGNIFGIGVVLSSPSNLVGGVPLPFIIGTQDTYIKWRANESLFVFKELDTFKRR